MFFRNDLSEEMLDDIFYPWVKNKALRTELVIEFSIKIWVGTITMSLQLLCHFNY